jgi:ribosomal protein S10
MKTEKQEQWENALAKRFLLLKLKNQKKQVVAKVMPNAPPSEVQKD